MSTPANTIDASIAFDYQGQRHSGTLTLDLDQLMTAKHTLPPLHSLLAAKMHIDPYSYEYEILLAEPIHFSRAQGMASRFLHQGQFEKQEFERAWQEQRIDAQLQIIAQRRLAVTSLAQQPALQAALREAYEAGRQAADSHGH